MYVPALRIAAAAALAMTLSWRAHAVPSLEYGPEVEARFVETCIEEPGMTPAACRTLMESLQRRLGYAGFLEFVAGDPDAAMIAVTRTPAELAQRHWASPD